MFASVNNAISSPNNGIRLFHTKRLSEPMLINIKLDP